MTNVRRRAAIVLVVVFGLFAGVGIAASTFTAGGGATYETPSGFVVTSAVDHSVGYDNPFSGSDSVDINNVTFEASGGDLTVDQFEGTFTNVSSIATNGTTVRVNPGDKPAVNISGSVTAIDFREPSLAQPNRVEFIYSASGDGSITVSGLPTVTSWAAASSGSVIDSGSTGASGTATISLSAASNSEVEIFAPDAPTVAPVEPTDGAELTNPTTDIAVDVDDADFGQPTDEVNVSIYADGARIHSENITSAGEVNTTHTFASGGEHTWYATATDATGRTTQTATQTVDVVAELRVLNESAPEQLVDETEVEVQFAGSEQTITRSATDGTVSFQGLPLDEQFEAIVRAEGYETRTIVLPSLLEQQRVWLLPNSASSVQVRFRLQDATGTYTQRSELYIEKPIEIDNQTRYRIINSRQFGVDGITVNLESDTRYDLRIRNQQGDTAQLSTYSASISETVTLEPSAATVEKPEDQAVGYEIGYDQDNEQINIEYIDPAEQTESLTVSVKSRDGEDVLREEQTYSDANSLSLSVPTGGKLNKTYLVNVTGDRAGDQIEISQPVGPPQRDLVPTGLSEQWKNVAGIFLVLLIGGVFSTLNAAVGAMVTALFGGLLWFFGILSGVASGGSIVLALGIASLNLFNSRR